MGADQRLAGVLLFYATDSPMSAFAAIVGAAVGANLFVLILDITQESLARSVAETPSTSTPPRHASRSG